MVPDHKANEEMIDSLMPDKDVDFPDLMAEMDTTVNEDDDFMKQFGLDSSQKFPELNLSSSGKKAIPANVLNKSELQKAQKELDEAVTQKVADKFGSSSPEMEMFLEGFDENVVSDFLDGVNQGAVETNSHLSVLDDLEDDVFAN